MRIEKSVTSITWIPSEAIKGMTKLPFEIGVTHYDNPPPDVIEDLGELLESGAIRFANVLKAWIEVEDGRIVDAGYSGGGKLGVTNFSVGSRHMLFPTIAFPDKQADPEITGSSARFVQTAGGRTPLPAPRHVNRPPFVQVTSPIAWTTLGLTISVDGSTEHDLVGASTFPRHWVYDDSGKLAAKSGLIDFKTWYRTAFGEHTPWGDEDSPAIVTEVETALERELSRTLMQGRKPKIKKVAEGKKLVEQGREGTDMFLLLDGVLRVDVGGESLAELGPGAIVGERAILEGGTRTSTLTAVTPCKVAVVPGQDVDKDALTELAQGHKREEQQ
jgi:Cyclic nucleotide-binding domain